MSEHSQEDNWLFGFWVYLMTDLVMFAVLFACYVVYQNATAGGPGPRELFGLPNALNETMLLLASSFTSSVAMVEARRGKVNRSLAWFGLTFALGAAFLGLELAEFKELLAEGNGPQRNAFLSAFFSLVGTHGLHIAVGLLWMGVAMVQMKLRGATRLVMNGLERFGLFWHFLDVVWIFIFTVVYLMSRVTL